MSEVDSVTYATTGATSIPATNGDLPPDKSKRNGSRGLLPSTWTNRTLRIEYAGADGKATTTSGVLLDWYPAGVVLSMSGAKTLIPWERLVMLELREDA